MHPIIEKVTQEVIERSHPTRSAYLKYIDGIAKKGPSDLEWAAATWRTALLHAAPRKKPT